MGVANHHHHTAAIAPRQMSRSASGVRKEIGSILSGREASINRSPAVCQEYKAARLPLSGAAVLPRRDKVVTLLDKIRNTRHQISASGVNSTAAAPLRIGTRPLDEDHAPSPPHWGPI